MAACLGSMAQSQAVIVRMMSSRRCSTTGVARAGPAGRPMAAATPTVPPPKQKKVKKTKKSLSQKDRGIFDPHNDRLYQRRRPEGFLCSEQFAGCTSDTGPTGVGAVPGAMTESETSTLVLMRHGESMWNDMNLFTGDVDIPLTEKGVIEAMAGGKVVQDIDFDVIFSSRLCRANMTAMIAMTQSKSGKVPVRIRGGVRKADPGDANRHRLRDAAVKALYEAECDMVPLYADPSLNERCYGDLQGLNKSVAEKEFGAETVAKWRRSYDTVPPHGESLLQTGQRAVSFFEEHTVPRLADGQNVLLVAHGNVLRCIVTHICGLSMDDCMRMHLATAAPLVFSFNRTDECFQQMGCAEPVNPLTGQVIPNKPRGLASVLKKANLATTTDTSAANDGAANDLNM